MPGWMIETADNRNIGMQFMLSDSFYARSLQSKQRIKPMMKKRDSDYN
jgi:hypothetical protein